MNRNELASVVELYVITRDRVAHEACDRYRSLPPLPKNPEERALRIHDMPTCME